MYVRSFMYCDKTTKYIYYYYQPRLYRTSPTTNRPIDRIVLNTYRSEYVAQARLSTEWNYPIWSR